MKSEKQSFGTTRLGSLAIGGVPVCFLGRDFPMLAKAAVWAALVRLFNWLMDEFLS